MSFSSGNTCPQASRTCSDSPFLLGKDILRFIFPLCLLGGGGGEGIDGSEILRTHHLNRNNSGQLMSLKCRQNQFSSTALKLMVFLSLSAFGVFSCQCIPNTPNTICSTPNSTTTVLARFLRRLSGRFRSFKLRGFIASCLP